jgi:hypothetical protein
MIIVIILNLYFFGFNMMQNYKNNSIIDVFNYKKSKN